MSEHPFPFICYLIVVDRGPPGQNPAFYIGITNNLARRIKTHKSSAFGHSKKEQFRLQKTMAKYGENALFCREIDRRATREEINRVEQNLIDLLRKEHGVENIMNISNGGDGWSSEDIHAMMARRTPEERADAARKGNARQTPEQKTERGRKAQAQQTAEQRSENARKTHKNRTTEHYRQSGIKAAQNFTSEQRSERARKIAASRTPEQRSEAAKKSAAKLTPEQHADRGRKTMAGLTAEQKIEMSQKGAAARRRPLVTNFGEWFRSVTDAARAVGVSSQMIFRAMKRDGNCKGRSWSYADQQYFGTTT